MGCRGHRRSRMHPVSGQWWGWDYQRRWIWRLCTICASRSCLRDRGSIGWVEPHLLSRQLGSLAGSESRRSEVVEYIMDCRQGRKWMRLHDFRSHFTTCCISRKSGKQVRASMGSELSAQSTSNHTYYDSAWQEFGQTYVHSKLRYSSPSLSFGLDCQSSQLWRSSQSLSHWRARKGHARGRRQAFCLCPFPANLAFPTM